MTVYYIDSRDGSDANNGTSTATPFQTIGRVVTVTSGTGSHEIYLRRDRRFVESVFFNSATGFTGTAAAPFIFGCWGGTANDPLPIWDAGTGRYCLRCSDTSTAFNYLTIQDIDFVGPGTTSSVDSECININNGLTAAPTQTIIRRCKFHGTGKVSRGSIIGYGMAVALSINGLWEYNEIYDISDDAITTSAHTAIPVYNQMIRYNKIYRFAQSGLNAGDGIEIGGFPLTAVTFRGNYIDASDHNSKQCLIMNHSSADNIGYGFIVEDNIFIRKPQGGPTSDTTYVNTACAFIRNPGTIFRRNKCFGGEYGIIISNSAADQTISDNLFVDTGTHILCGQGTGHKIYGNTLAHCRPSGNGQLGISINVGGNTDVTIKNNILVDNTFGINSTVTSLNTFNSYWQNGANFRNSAASGTGEITTDPGLVNYVPSTSSNVYGTGTFIDYSRDITGKLRRNPVTMGCYDVPYTRGTR